MQASKLSGVPRLMVFHNPFYLISAGLFVYGLKLLWTLWSCADYRPSFCWRLWSS